MRNSIHKAISIVAKLLLAGLILFLSHAATRPLAWGDHFWQIRAGLEILETGVLPEREAWSYTVAGVRWNNHEWGYEVLAAAGWRAWGWGGVRLAVWAGVCLPLVALGWRWRRAGLPVVAAGVTAVALAAMYKINPAPQLAGFGLGIVGWMWFARADLLDRPWRLAGLGAFCLLWGNLSAECLSWVALLLCSQTGSVIGRIRAQTGAERAGRRGVAGLGLAVALCLVNPPQSSVIEYALVGTAINREVNTEFSHLWERATTLTPGVQAALVAGILLWAGWAAVRVAHAGRVDGAGAALAAGLRLLPGVAAIAAMVIYTRFSALIWLPLDLWMATLAGGSGGSGGSGESRESGGRDAVALLLAGGLSVVAAWELGWSPGLAMAELRSARWWTEHVDAAANPVGCAAGLAALPAGTRVFSSRAWGNYLHSAAPHVRVFIDGRNREFPVALHRMAMEATAGGPDTAEILNRSGTDVVLADPGWNRRSGLEEVWAPAMVSGRCAIFLRR